MSVVVKEGQSKSDPVAIYDMQRGATPNHLPYKKISHKRSLLKKEYSISATLANRNSSKRTSVSLNLLPDRNQISKEEAKKLSSEWYEEHFDDEDGLFITKSYIKKLKSNEVDKDFLHKTLLQSVQVGDSISLFQTLELYNKFHLIDDYNSVLDTKGCTLMSIAAAEGNESMLFMLFGMTNIGINVPNTLGYTTISIAGYYRQVKTVPLLLQFGADLSLRNTDRESCLVVCANRVAAATTETEYNEYLEICKIFVERSPLLGNQFIREYSSIDHKNQLIKDPRTRLIIYEWVKCRHDFKTLFSPPHDMFVHSRTGMNLLVYFFQKRHKEMRLWPWIKIAILVAFIIYDVVLNGFSENLLIYIALYGLAYFL